MATVLIVDDDQTTRAMIGIAVEELGHQPTYAHDGDECVEMVKSQTYDIIFMDLAMPAKNGIIAIQEILEEYPSTKIIAMRFPWYETGEGRVRPDDDRLGLAFHAPPPTVSPPHDGR